MTSSTNAGPSDFPHELQWKKCDIRSLQNISSPINAAFHGDTAYFRHYRSRKIYSYNLTSGWSVWADCLVRDCSLVVLPVPYQGADQLFLLHTIGGIKRKVDRTNKDKEEFTNAIYQLTDIKWTRSITYPKLKTERSQMTVVYSEDHVIIAGGCSADLKSVNTVDVLTITCQHKEWREVASLPYPVYRASGCVCNGMLYILGGHVSPFDPIRSACVATVSELVEAHSNEASDKDIFKIVKDLELYDCVCVSFRNCILAIGGWKSDASGTKLGTKLVYVYHEDEKVWKELKGRLSESRCYPFAAAFKDKIMIVGGYNRPNGTCTDSVEFGILPSDEPKQVCQALLPSEREASVEGALAAEKVKKDNESQWSSRKRPLPGRDMSDDQQPAVKKQKHPQASHQRKRSLADAHGMILMQMLKPHTNTKDYWHRIHSDRHLLAKTKQ
ncbi:kelch-like protein 14 isoform X2 [Halichondria panicea]|uniref:kelch-like protein 14 isoform X2 n=1 Tax=Halichondria panicea TaxID=6063 RepID=UPI00312B9064